MNKLLTTLGAITLLSSGASSVMVCSKGATDPTSNFNLWNLSTWGDTQKATIIKNYLAIAKKHYNAPFGSGRTKTWSQWSDTATGYETPALINSFELIFSF